MAVSGWLRRVVGWVRRPARRWVYEVPCPDAWTAPSGARKVTVEEMFAAFAAIEALAAHPPTTGVEAINAAVLGDRRGECLRGDQS